MKQTLIAIVFLCVCTSCVSQKRLLEKADFIEYNFNGPSVAPEYNRGYTFEISPEKIVVTVRSYSTKLLTKTFPFSQQRFDSLMQTFSEIKKRNLKDGSIPVGGGYRTIKFYKSGKLVMDAVDYGQRARDFTGAEINLGYLIPEIGALIDSTRTE